MNRQVLLLALCLAVASLAQPEAGAQVPSPTPSYVIRATTADPATGTLRWGRADGVTCQVAADAGSHAVTVEVRLVTPDGVAMDWDEWTSAAGTATSTDPYTVVIPYPLYELRLSVENAAGSTITAVCLPWGGAR